MDTELVEIRAGFEGEFASRDAGPDVVVERTLLGGVPAEVVSTGAHERTVLYFHGGGYCVGSPRTHRAVVAAIARAARARAFAVDYRLAPEHPFPAAIDDAFASYRAVIEQEDPRKLVVAGDSAGGGLAVSVLARAHEAGLPLAAGCVALSPWVDLARRGATLATKAAVDNIVQPPFLERLARAYLAGHDPLHPLASPLEASFLGFPPLLIQAGTEEVLLADATRLAEKVAFAGRSVVLETFPGLGHVFQFEAATDAARRAFERIGAFVVATTRG